MAYVNMDIRDRSDEYKRLAMLQAELTFWQEEARRLQAMLENIPRAIERWGHVDLDDGSETIRLIAKPAEDGEDRSAPPH